MDNSLLHPVNEDLESLPLVGHMHTGGLTVFMTAIFMVGEMAGSGVLALPSAIEATGWIGLVLIPLCGYISSYTGDVLGQCWAIVQQRFPAMRGDIRYPYPAIGMLTFGRVGRLVISLSINFTLFGVSCVFLLLASQNIQSVFRDNGAFNLSFCYWLMIVCAILLPLTMPATPKNFKWVAMGASAATSVACVILVVLMGLDSNKADHERVVHSKIDLMSFAAAFGTICFAFGGHPTFPTFQNDMKQPHRFGTSCMIAYTAVALLYFPVATGGYFVYGSALKDNVLLSVSGGPALSVIQVLITVHLFCSYIIVINPLNQELEEIFKVDKLFSWKRVAVRTSTTLIVLFIAETIPHFGAILSLIGGSSTTLLAYIAPPVFYFKLCYSKHFPTIEIPIGKKVLLLEIMVVGIFAGIFSTYSAIKDLASPKAFTLPCFINITAASG